MGAVDSQETIANLILQKEEEARNQFKELTIDAGANIKVIPELVYQAKINNKETLTKVDSALVVEAEAYEVSVNGKTVAYLKDANEYEEVVKQLKLQYISEQQIEEWNNRNVSNIELQPLQLNENRIVDIYVLEDMKGQETKALPSEILTVDQVVELLKTGSVQQEIYTVQQGDVLGAIASKHNLKIAELLNLNPGLEETTLLKIGQQLNVTAVKPYVSIAVVYENLKEEVMQYIGNKVTAEYVAYNKALYERLKQYDITKNQEHGKFLDKAPALYFDHGPYHWDVPKGYYDGCAKNE